MNFTNTYKDCLLQNVIPFWEKNSIDYENGGYFTCLNTKGEIYDTDKFMWLQERQAWTSSMLYNKVENSKKNDIDFIKNHGMDAEGNFYFSTTNDGKPLVQPYNIFSNCF